MFIVRTGPKTSPDMYSMQTIDTRSSGVVLCPHLAESIGRGSRRPTFHQNKTLVTFIGHRSTKRTLARCFCLLCLSDFKWFRQLRGTLIGHPQQAHHPQQTHRWGSLALSYVQCVIRVAAVCKKASHFFPCVGFCLFGVASRTTVG